LQVGAMSDKEQTLAEVERRVQKQKSTGNASVILRLKQKYKFDDAVDLALRMLDPADLKKVSGDDDLEWKLAEVPDTSKFMISLIHQLDPEVGELTQKLLELDGGGAPKPAPALLKPKQPAFPPSHPRVAASAKAAATPGDDVLVASVEGRLNGNKDPKCAALIQKVKQDHGLGDEVELALRLLPPTRVKSLLANRRELDSAMEGAPDKNEFMLDVISSVDSEVVETVQKLMRLDTGASSGQPAARAQAPAAAGKGMAAAPKIQPPAFRGSVAVAAKGGAAAAGTSDAGFLASVEGRLNGNKNPVTVGLIQKVKQDYGLGDQVELALRMLPPFKVKSILANRGELDQALAGVSNKDEFMLDVISDLDSEVVTTVNRLMQMDGGAGGGQPAAKVQARAAARSRSPRPLATF